MFMSSKHAREMGADAFHNGQLTNPFPYTITYCHDWEYGYSTQETCEEWYAEDSDWIEQEDIDFYEDEQLDWEHEIDARDFDIPDKRSGTRTIYCEE